MPESKTDQVKVAVKAYVLHFLLKLQTFKPSLSICKWFMLICFFFYSKQDCNLQIWQNIKVKSIKAPYCCRTNATLVIHGILWNHERDEMVTSLVSQPVNGLTGNHRYKLAIIIKIMFTFPELAEKILLFKNMAGNIKTHCFTFGLVLFQLTLIQSITNFPGGKVAEEVNVPNQITSWKHLVMVTLRSCTCTSLITMNISSWQLQAFQISNVATDLAGWTKHVQCHRFTPEWKRCWLFDNNTKINH